MKGLPDTFDDLPVPCFVIDDQSKLVRINEALGSILDEGGVPRPQSGVPAGMLLEVAVGSLESYLADPSLPEPLVSLFGDAKPRSFKLTANRTADGLLGVLLPIQRSPTVDLQIPMRAIEAYLELSKKVNVLMREEEVLQLFVEMLHRLFPDYNHCIRLLDEKRKALGLVYADGVLVEEVRNRVFITPEAFESKKIPDAIQETYSDVLKLEDSHPFMFEGSRSGMLVALADEETLFGTLHVETDRTAKILPFQRLLCFALSHHLTSALRNTRLFNESMNLRDYLTKLIDHAHAPIVIIDGKRKITTINKSLSHMTGYTKSDLIGTDFLDLFQPQDRQRFVTVIRKAAKSIPTTNYEVNIPRRTEGDVQISFNITSVLDQYGKVEAVIAVGQDLTEIRRLQEQMVHTERLATIGQLSAGVVHEINNPLTSISVYSEAMLQKAQEADQTEEVKRLERIHHAAERIFKFTQQLMAYARPTEEEPTLVDLPEVVKRSLGFCEHVIYKAGVTVDRSFPEGVAPVYGIEGQLEQVFVNLITNACHAMKRRDGKLTLAITEGQEGTLTIQISDEGEGIETAKLKRIFDPFFTTKVEGEGTGLGLSIVKNIIANHDGDISVSSVPGEGTTFTITLYTSG